MNKTQEDILKDYINNVGYFWRRYVIHEDKALALSELSNAVSALSSVLHAERFKESRNDN